MNPMKSEYIQINTGILDMRILVLTLMMSFLSHSAFGAAEGGEEVANYSFWGWTKSQAWGLHQLLTSLIDSFDLQKSF